MALCYSLLGGFGEQRDQNLEVDAILGAAEDLLGFKPKAHVQEQVPVGTDEVREQQLVFDLVHGVGQEEPPATAGGREQFGRKPGDVEKGIEPSQVADGIAADNEIPWAVG